MVANYESGANWMGYPAGSEICGPSAGVKLVSYDQRWFAMESSDAGIKKYLSVDRYDDGFVKATSNYIGDNELFEFVVNPGMEGMNRFFLRSKLGNYLVVKPVYSGYDTIYQVAMAHDSFTGDEMSIVGCFNGYGGFMRF